DGDQDIAGVSINDRKIAWYINDGFGHFSGEQVIDILPSLALEIDVADLDNDGNVDVLSSFGGKIIWYRNDGRGNFTKQPLIEGFDRNIDHIELQDIDGDGHLDILAAAWLSDELRWFENDEMGGFSQRITLDTNVRRINSLVATDFDGDQDLDILALVLTPQTTLSDSVFFYENDGSGVFSKSTVVVARMDKIFVADLDGDTQMDIISIGIFGNDIFWHQNMGGTMFADPVRLNPDLDGLPEAILTDVNKDGFIDIIAYSRDLFNGIVWYENDGSGVFSAANIISTKVDEVQSFFLEDIDGDNELDLLSGSNKDNKIAWYRSLISSNITSSKNSQSKEKINLFPNPTNDLFYIHAKGVDEQPLRIVLRDNYGRLVASRVLEDELTLLSFQNLNLAKGLYYYEIYAPSGILQIGKLIRL
ncbi:MAG: FG-GAP-like repeat-containing protein, partial [Bacteroidota bacterium]